MPTFDTPNSQGTYDVPANAVAVDVLIRGGVGGDGESDYTAGGDGGPAGTVAALLPVDGGETLTYYVGEAGGDGSGISGGPGGQSPLDGGVTGGDGGAGSWGGPGGGGGAPSALERQSDGATLAVGEGAGGGGGSGDSASGQGGGGGGGGARGGAGGASGLSGDGNSNPGGDATGTGDGGDGGAGGGDFDSGTDGQAGGTTTHADLQNVTTGTSSAGPVVEIVPRTPPAAPTGVQPTDVRPTEIDLGWTDEATDEDGYRVFESDDGGQTETQVADLAVDTTSYTLTGLRNGEEYLVRVEAYNDVGTASDTAGPATTVLSDAEAPTLDNGVEDEIAVSWTDVSNYGDYRVQLRETGQSAWDASATGYQETVVGHDTTSTTFNGLEDGEEYEVRLRTETEHVTGAWTTPVAITTQFPTPANPSASADSPTQAALSWTDQADNEDGFLVLRREQFGSGWSDWRQLADLGANTESYTDASAQSSSEYEYEIRAYTEDATATSTVDLTMPSLGVGTEPTDATGWAVAIERSDGVVRRPSVLDDAEIRPRLKSRPEVSIPVRADDSWLDTDWEGAQMRVWRDGERIPIDTVASVDPQPDRTVLVGRGGKQLTRRAQYDVDDTNTHDLLRTLIDQTTDYTYTVDPPGGATDTFLTGLEGDDWDDYVAPPADAPVGVVDGAPQLLQSNQLLAPQQFGGVAFETNASENWTASEAFRLDPETSTQPTTFEVPYDIPADRVGVAFRDALDDVTGWYHVEIDGQTVYGILIGGDGTDAGQSVSWSDRSPDSGTSYQVDGMPALEAGEHTIQIWLESEIAFDTNYSAEGNIYVDCVSIFDTDEHSLSEFSDTLDSNERLDGPPGIYPTEGTLTLSEIPAVERVSALSLNSSWSDISGPQQIEASIDGGESFPASVSNSETLDYAFDSDGAGVTLRVTFGRVDATDVDTVVESSITTTGTESQRLDWVNLQVDTVESPGVQDRALDGRLADVMTELCNRANLEWEVQWNNGGQHIVVTRMGQRTSAVDPSLVDWEISKDLDRRVSAAIVYGRMERVEGEEFTADLNPTSLANDSLKPGSTRVYDSDGAVYERGENEDYTVNHVLGNVRVVGGSDMTTGETYSIDYEEGAQEAHYGPNHGDGEGEIRQPVVEEIPTLRTDAQARQAALYIVKRASRPLWSATVTIARQDVGYRLTETLDPSQLPTPDGQGLRVQSIDESPGQIVLELGLGQSVGEIVSDLQGKLSDTARQA